MSKELRVVPLGGLGEFGMNMMALESGGDAILVDAGMLFPEPEQHGVETIVPDFEWVVANRDKMRGLVLTHAHQDHIGAVPYLLEQVDMPVYGTAFTLGLVRKAVSEFTSLKRPRYVTIEAGQELELGCFQVEGVQVTHSTPQCLALAIDTPAGCVIHTGDFKIDQTPVDDSRFDFAKFAEYGRRGVLLLMSDSTNADVPGFSKSEKDVGLALDDVFTHADQALFFTCFSSAVQRVQQIVDRAVDFGRKVAFVGRSLDSACEIASDLGLLRVPAGTLVDHRDIGSYPRRDRVSIIAGSQGEPLSSLARASVGRHRAVDIEEGDTVAFSAKMIPGNEKRILRMVNHLYRRGAKVLYGSTFPDLHVSGHPCQEELKLMLNLVRPRYFVPLHGEYRQLVQHRNLAARVRGRDLEEALVLENGCVLQFDEHGARILPDKVPMGHRLIDSGTADVIVEDVGAVMKDRRLSTAGVLVPLVSIDERPGASADVAIVSRGFVVSEDSRALLDGAEDAARKAVDSSSAEERGDAGLMEEKVRDEIRRYLGRKTSRRSRPLIVPVILEG